jgi:hypothetical protein
LRQLQARDAAKIPQVVASLHRTTEATAEIVARIGGEHGFTETGGVYTTVNVPGAKAPKSSALLPTAPSPGSS